MTSKGKIDDFNRLLRDDVRHILNAILPEAITGVLDEILREYKDKLTNEQKTLPRLTYAETVTGTQGQLFPHTQGQSVPQANVIHDEIQRFNVENRWFMNNMYRKREAALFKQIRCERLTAIYEECQKLDYVPRGFRKDNYNLLTFDEYKKLHDFAKKRFMFEYNILKSHIPMFKETISRTDEVVKNFIDHLQGYKNETIKPMHNKWQRLFEIDRQRIMKK